MINLKKITFDNIDDCLNLQTHEYQKDFVATNAQSLAEAYVALETKEGVPIPFAIYDDDLMVGFIMLAFNEPDDFLNEPSYWIWRFMIDKNYQGKGYGKNALNKIIKFANSMPSGQAPNLYVSYEPNNIHAKKLYESFGFKETGRVLDDGELMSKLPLKNMK